MIVEMLVVEKSCSLFSRCSAYCPELLPLSRQYLDPPPMPIASAVPAGERDAALAKDML